MLRCMQVLGLHGDALPAMAMNTNDGRVLTYAISYPCMKRRPTGLLSYLYVKAHSCMVTPKSYVFVPRCENSYNDESFTEVAMESWVRNYLGYHVRE